MAYFTRLAFTISFVTCALGLGAMLGGCGDDFNDRVACSVPSDCGLPADMTERECCSGFCVALAPGCDSGYRYITSEPGFGDCAVSPMCKVSPDLSVPLDKDAGN